MKESDRIAMLIETARIELLIETIIAEIEEHIKENSQRDKQLKNLFGQLKDIREKSSEVTR